MALLPFGGRPFKTPLAVTNAPVSGTAGAASQINTGDPNTKGLIVKANTFFPASKVPTDISGLGAWYKVDSITPVADNTQLSTWTDSSGNGFTLTGVANGNGTPRYFNNIYNGHPTVRFAGSFRTTTFTNIPTPYTVILVLNPTVAPLNCYVSNTTSMAILSTVNTPPVQWKLNNGNSLVSSTTATAGVVVVVSYVVNGASSTIRVNGTQVASGNAGTFWTGTGTTLQIGGIATGAANDDIPEFAIWSGALSTADQDAVATYLGAKYGITIAGQIPQVSNLQEWQDSNGNVLSGVDASGRNVVATLAGTPTGTPPAGTMIYDTTAHKLWVYDAGWKYAQFT